MNKHKSANEKKRVAVYCRVSTDHDDQSNSFESQQRYFKQYISHHADWVLSDIFADEGISGTSTKKRKEFNRMIASAENGEFDLIITKDISRFARNTLDSIYYTRSLKRQGIGVIFMNDGINTLEGDAELRLTIMASIAQEESRKTSERVKWGQKRRMEQGVVFGRSMLGYDVKDGKMTVNEEGAAIVRLIFHKFVNEGKGSYIIARELREEGIKPMRVKQWHNTVILRIIRNEKYCGDLVQKKTFTPDYLSHEKKYNRGQEELVIIKDHHEAIISREMFEKANKILEEKKLSHENRPKHSERYLLSGKVRCGRCGAAYVARYKKRKDGTQYKAWRCYEAVKNGAHRINELGNIVGCSGMSVRNEDIIHIMSLVTQTMAFNREDIAENLMRIIKQSVEADVMGADPQIIKERIQTEEEKKRKLLDLYLSGIITKGELASKGLNCDKEIEKLQSMKNLYNKQHESLLCEIGKAIQDIIIGTETEDVFYKEILDRIVINDRSHIDVFLKHLPIKWSFAQKTH